MQGMFALLTADTQTPELTLTATMPFLGPEGELRACWAALAAGELGWEPLVEASLLLLLRASKLPAPCTRLNGAGACEQPE